MLAFISLLIIGQADLQIPQGPISIMTSDQPVRAGASSRMMFFTGTKPGLLSLKASEFSNRDLIISKLPANMSVGSRSLFYMKDDVSTEFIFTNQNRTTLYYANNGGTYPIVSTKTCGPFSEISDIHITEVSGSASRVIILDKGANTVYSYSLTPSSASLCSSGVTLSLTSPQWVQSLTSATPTLYIGYQTSAGLQIRSYNSVTLAAATAQETLATHSRASFGQPFYDYDSSELFVPVMNANDATNGDDFIVHYASDFSSRTTLMTCRSPVKILRDFEGSTRYRYVFCPSDHVVYVYNSSDTLLKKLSAGSNPLKMMVGSNGTYRWVAILQSTPNLVLHQLPADASAALTVTTNTVALPKPMNDIGHFAAFDYAVTVSREHNLISFVSLASAAVSDTQYLPQSITSMAPQSSSIMHFVSDTANAAYTLTEQSSTVWQLRNFTVGTNPVKIGYRTNRLYVLNRDSNNLSVVNLTSNAVTNISTQTRPIDFDFDTTLDRLWAINSTSQSVTRINITSGSEAAVDNTALGFTPKKILYQSADSPATLYVAGSTTARSLTASSMATVATQTLTGAYSDMVRLSTGVAISSKQRNLLSTMTRSTLTDSTLSSTPTFLASNGTFAVTGLQNSNLLYTSTSLSKSIRPFDTLFSNLTNLFVYSAAEKRVRIFPYSVMSSTTFASASASLDINPTVTAADSSANEWLGDTNRMQIQRISSDLQRNLVQNMAPNYPSDILGWTAKTRIYVALRNANAIAVINSSTGGVTGYSTCESPRKLALDTTSRKLFVMCTESDAISSFALDTSGDVSSHSLLAGASRPTGMALNQTTQRLYVTNSGSNTVRIFNSSSNAIVSNVTVSSKPMDVAVNESNARAYVVHMNSGNLTTLSSTFAATNFDTGILGMTQVAVNSSSGFVFGLSPSLNSYYYPSGSITYSATTSLVDDAHNTSLATSATYEEEFLTYTDDDVVRVLAEDGTVTDIAVGDSPVFVFPWDAKSTAYVSNFGDDTLTEIDLDDNSVTRTISLTEGCGPTKAIGSTVSSVDYVYVVCQNNDSLEIVTQSDGTVGTPISLRF